MVSISIPKNILLEAVSHSKERIEFEYDRFGLNNEERKDKILVGAIGQLIFELLLKSKNIIYKHEYQAGNFDQFDFKVNDCIIDIKTSSYYNSYSYLNLLYEESQYQSGLKKGYDYCVQIFINGKNKDTGLVDLERCNLASISGYIDYKKIINFSNQRQYYGDDYKVPLPELTSINNLFDHLR